MDKAAHFARSIHIDSRSKLVAMTSEEIREGDRVEYVGPPPERPGDPALGERGTVITDEGPGAWIVRFDRASTAVYDESLLRKVEE